MEVTDIQAALGGDYAVDRVLAEGSMTLVVAARDVRTAAPVAVKILRPQASGVHEALARFQREAEVMRRIQSDHVVRLLGAGGARDGSAYMVMEYLEGESLGRGAQAGAKAVQEVVQIMLEACEGLGHVHAAGVIHRNLSPENLFLARSPSGTSRVKVLGFRLSKVEMDSANLTATASLLGTPAYMSPEQMHSAKHVDGRTDIWSLGVTLYELLAGRPPFEAANLIKLFMKVVQEQPVPLRDRRPDLPAGLVSVVDKCLEKEPAKRYAAVADLAEALEPFGPEACRGTAARIRAIPTEAGALSLAPKASASSRSALPLILGIVVVVSIAVAIALFFVLGCSAIEIPGGDSPAPFAAPAIEKPG